MRTTISVPDPLLESAKHHAEARGVTVSIVVEDALRSYLAQSGRRSAGPFRLPTVKGKLVHPDLDLDRTSALALTDDEAAYRRR
ncbi:MAG: ribbon-helix-helix domain-containing protein [Bryobacteraceae bacterium]